MNNISSLHTHRTLIDRLRHWCERKPDAPAYTFLKERARFDRRLSFSALYETVAARAADLLARDLTGQRVMIALPSGLDYIVNFLACFAAGAIAVPMYPPATRRDWDKIFAVAQNCRPSAAVASSQDVEALMSALGGATGMHPLSFILVDEHPLPPLPAPLSRPAAAFPAIEPDQLAFLQYTSGSTGQPKGVMVSHRNILHNAAQHAHAMGSHEDSVHVSWLPLYHDMGLIGIVLQALSLGSHAVLMSPYTFIRNPLNWLRAITEYAGTTSGGPNFAFDLCVDKIDEAEIDTLDLSHWRTAFNGSEQIKASTLERFTKRFARANFRAEAFFPCYGLAEATLYVSGASLQRERAALTVDRAALAAGQALRADRTGNGDAFVDIINVYQPPADLTAAIVDPNTWKTRPAGTIGEIWLKGANIAGGYWERPVETAETFRAYLADTGEGPFLRTGDLGFIANADLHITGRIKEMIIANGANHYPQDIEATIETLGEPLRTHCGAAFALPDERLAIVQGLDRSKLSAEELDATIERIRRVVWDVHGIAPAFVGLVQPGDIAKTSSGKIQRALIARRHATGELSLLASWVSDEQPAPSASPAPSLRAPDVLPPSAETLAAIEWIKGYFPRRVNSQLIDERRTIAPYVVLDLGNRGLLGMLAPRAAGGLGFTTADFLRVLETLGAKDMTIALFVGLNNALGIRPIANHGSSEAQAKHLAPLAAGRELAAFALTEPGAGSNPGALLATARRMPDSSYRLNGTKYWSGSAAWAGVINVFAKTLDAQGTVTGVTGFAIPQDSPGLRQGPEALTMGMRGMVQNVVILEDVAAFGHQVLGSADHGMSIAQDTLCYGRLAISAVCLGAAKRCYRTMVRYASRREISTGSLLANPHTRAVLNDARHAITALEHLVADTSARVDAAMPVPAEWLAVCKCLSTEWLWTIVDQTMQMMGGRGYIESNEIAQVFRDARVFRIFEGPTEALHHFLGSSVARTPLVLRAYLSTLIGGDALQKHFDEAFSNMRDDASGSDADAAHWRYSAAGRHVCELAFHAIGQACPTLARGWLDERLDASRRTFEKALRQPAIGSADVLSAFAQSIDAQLGADECQTPHPEFKRDPWLAPQAPNARAKTHEAPSEPALPAVPPPAAQTPRAAPGTTGKFDEIAGFITQWIARHCGIRHEAVGFDVEFALLGLGSIDSSALAEVLSERFSVDIDPTVLWNYPNTRELATFIGSKIELFERA